MANKWQFGIGTQVCGLNNYAILPPKVFCLLYVSKVTFFTYTEMVICEFLSIYSLERKLY